MSHGLFLLKARGDILRYTDIGKRAFPYTSPPYGSDKPQPIDGCWGVGRPAPAVLSYCCAGILRTMSRDIVTVFNNEAREPDVLGFPREKSRRSVCEPNPACWGVPSVPVPTGLSSHSHQLQLRLHKKNPSKLRTALECISPRASTIFNYYTKSRVSLTEYSKAYHSD